MKRYVLNTRGDCEGLWDAQIIQSPVGRGPPVRTQINTKTYTRPPAPTGPTVSLLADPNDTAPPIPPPAASADPGRHTSDHQSFVQGAVPFGPVQDAVDEDEAAVPVTPVADTKSTQRNRTKLPNPPASAKDPGDSQPASNKTQKQLYDTNHPRDRTPKSSALQTVGNPPEQKARDPEVDLGDPGEQSGSKDAPPADNATPASGSAKGRNHVRFNPDAQPERETNPLTGRAPE